MIKYLSTLNPTLRIHALNYHSPSEHFLFNFEPIFSIEYLEFYQLHINGISYSKDFSEITISILMDHLP